MLSVNFREQIATSLEQSAMSPGLSVVGQFQEQIATSVEQIATSAEQSATSLQSVCHPSNFGPVMVCLSSVNPMVWPSSINRPETCTTRLMMSQDIQSVS